MRRSDARIAETLRELRGDVAATARATGASEITVRRVARDAMERAPALARLLSHEAIVWFGGTR